MKTSKQTFVTPVGEVTYLTLTNARGSQVTLSSLGAGIIAIRVPDREGNMADVVIGYPEAADYIADGPCAGKTPGRYANRIANGRFTLEGKTYTLPVNNGPNHLHGGPDGYQNRAWEMEEVAPGKIQFTIESADGDAGYPANLKATVTYTWDDDDNLTIEYGATADSPTVVNLTNHSYFNLAGHDAGAAKAMNQLLQLNCSRWLPTDDTLVPTGELAPVDGTPMDFRKARKVGESIFPAGAAPSTENLITDFDAIRFGKGYDNCWMSDSPAGELATIATLEDTTSGRKLSVATDQPAVQVYGGNWVSGCPTGKDGAVYTDFCAVAIECQGCPDAPNKPGFPSQVVSPQLPYRRTIRFSFSAG
jgi:aldose 1-epimerase